MPKKKLKSKTIKVGNYEYVNVRVMKHMMINGVMREPLDVVVVESERAKRMIKVGDASDTKEADVSNEDISKKLVRGKVEKIKISDSIKIELN